MKGVDDVSLGMGGAADTLLLAAKSGDPALLEEQSESIQSLAQSLQEIANDAVEGYVWTLSNDIHDFSLAGVRMGKRSKLLEKLPPN